MAWSLSQILRLGMVPLNGDVTIAGEKTFTETTRIRAVLAGPRSNILTKGAGSSQPAASDSDAWITSDGAITIPTTAGWRCWLVLGGDHDISFNSTTLDVSAQTWGTGDILRIQVLTTTTIKLWRVVAAASVLDQTDFA